MEVQRVSDLIDRELTSFDLKEYKESCISALKHIGFDDIMSFEDIMGVVNDIPSMNQNMSELADRIEAKPVQHGRWVPVTNGRGGHECDQCRNYAPSYQTGEEHLSDYCPNCGARMYEANEIDPDFSPAITNGDYIRQMTDRQLAGLFFRCMSTDRSRCEKFGNCCWQCNYEWLKEERKEDERKELCGIN